MGISSAPFVPKAGGKLKVVGICRISTTHQDQRSLADQEASYREWLNQNVDVPWELEIISSQGSGENLERKAYLTLVDRTEEFDLVITEDLGRICRRIHSHLFCENAVDVQTRVIAINDHVDTAEEGWQLSSYFAAIRHEAYNQDTSKRIRRSLRNRFTQGGVVQCLPYGYIKPFPKATDQECSKDPQAESIFQEWFKRLEEGQSFAEVSDWLNAEGVSPGQYAGAKWTSILVGKVTRNPILKGQRCRNVKISQRINRTGQKRSVKAPPSELLIRECPNLAFFDAAYYDSVIAMLQQRNSKFRRGKSGRDVRNNVPRSRTRWPGQHLRCGVCGRRMVYGGNGQFNRLICDGARTHVCWNGFTADREITARNVLQALRDEMEQQEGFDASIYEAVHEEVLALQADVHAQIEELKREEMDLSRKITNLTDAIARLPASESLLVRLEEAESRSKEVRLRLQSLERTKSEQAPSLPNIDELKSLAREAFQDIDISSQDFARLMRGLISEIHVYPYCLIDGGGPVLRAKLMFSVTSFLPNPPRICNQLPSMQRTLVVDLFDKPKRELFRPAVVAGMQTPGMTYKTLAAQLQTNETVLQQAFKIQRMMDSAGVTDPYLPMPSPIEGHPKYCRHRHVRYQFQPLPGYDSPKFPPGRSC